MITDAGILDVNMTSERKKKMKIVKTSPILTQGFWI